MQVHTAVLDGVANSGLDTAGSPRNIIFRHYRKAASSRRQTIPSLPTCPTWKPGSNTRHWVLFSAQ